MKTFLDSPAFAKRFVEEKGSDEVDDICKNTSALALSIICIPEIMSALNRQLRDKHLSKQQYTTAKTRLLIEIEDAILINLTKSVITKSTILLESNVLRAMDALHIACALEWEANIFVSSDYRQIKAARNSGLKTVLIGA